MSDVAIRTRSPQSLFLALLGYLGLCAVVAAIGGAATASSLGDWYIGLNKPSFNPPNWVFGPVWTLLYVMMAVAAWRVWRRDRAGVGVALGLWAAQLALNLGWSLIFFGLHAPGPALVDLALLILATGATAFAFRRHDRLAAALLLPYLCWCGFAFALNEEIWRLN
jgi:tryptophan-rich sensory protein